MQHEIGRELAGRRFGLHALISWPPGARIISMRMKGNFLRNSLMTSCSTSVKVAV